MPVTVTHHTEQQLRAWLLSNSKWVPTPTQKAFLKGLIPEYKTAQEVKGLHDFWPRLFVLWFTKWPATDMAPQGLVEKVRTLDLSISGPDYIGLLEAEGLVQQQCPCECQRTASPGSSCPCQTHSSPHRGSSLLPPLLASHCQRRRRHALPDCQA